MGTVLLSTFENEGLTERLLDVTIKT